MSQHLSHDFIEQVRQWRLDLHRHPELAYQERRTGNFIAARLAEYGFKVTRGHGRTGVVGTLSRGTSSRAIGLRADMDALPIIEATGAAHASVNPGVMHACGHDGHVSMLLAAAGLASRRTDLDGTVHFIFQPAEEVEGGANAMIEDGLFRDLPVDAVYGLHNWPALAPGEIVARDGAMMAAFATFDIEIIGKGAHGAIPDESADPIVAAGQLIGAVQAIASRNVSPLQAAVVSITRLSGGDAYNIIPERVALAGTTRWFDANVGDLIEDRLAGTAQRIAAAFNCEAVIRYQRRYPATINDPSCAAFMREAAAAARLDVKDALPSMAAEDFAFMLNVQKGAYLWLGARRDGENPGLHSPRFDFNDAILPFGIRLWDKTIEMAFR